MSYNPALPTNLDELRFIIGDTRGGLDGTSGAEDIANETISAILTLNGITTRQARPRLLPIAVQLVRAIRAKYAPEGSSGGGTFETERQQRHRQWLDLEESLLKEIATAGGAAAGVFFGGASKSRAESLESNSDWRGPTFKIGEHDYS